ncbi:MAG: hypothetical protein QXW39_09890 [Candidatus Bathyarchaeia archaeon]
MLELGDILPVNKYRSSGKEYERIIAVAKKIAEPMRGEGLGGDLLDVDLSLYMIQSEVEGPRPQGLRLRLRRIMTSTIMRVLGSLLPWVRGLGLRLRA